ncbi:MAG: hypothetical protein ABIS35_07110 [Terracoccus sp.]
MGNFDGLSDMARNLAHDHQEKRPRKEPDVEQVPGHLDPADVEHPSAAEETDESEADDTPAPTTGQPAGEPGSE